MKDMVISVLSDWEFDKIKLWVNSLNRCGFKGRKAIVAFNISDSTINKLQQNGIEVFLTSQTRNPSNDGFIFEPGFTIKSIIARHFFYWYFLKDMKDIRYVIACDTDIVFQTDPSEWLENNLGDKKLNYGCEALTHQNEAWSKSVVEKIFNPMVADYMMDKPIYNAGSMAGEHSTFVDFSLSVFHTIQHLDKFDPIPDQAGVNFMLTLEPYKSITKYNDHDTNWACQCGTTVDPSKIHTFRPHLMSPEPIFDGNHVYNSKGEKYVMVHQFNRVPEWNRILGEKYA